MKSSRNFLQQAPAGHIFENPLRGRLRQATVRFQENMPSGAQNRTNVLTTALQHQAAAFGSHSGHEADSAFSSSVGRLKRSFHLSILQWFRVSSFHTYRPPAAKQFPPGSRSIKELEPINLIQHRRLFKPSGHFFCENRGPGTKREAKNSPSRRFFVAFPD